MEGKTMPADAGYMATFPAQLRTMRRRRRISGTVLGELCGLSKNLICQYERGEKEPSLATLVALADYFQVPLDRLLGRG